jgi:hypothetical protein
MDKMFTLALPAFLLQLLTECHQTIQCGRCCGFIQHSNAGYLMYINKQYGVAQKIIAQGSQSGEHQHYDLLGYDTMFWLIATNILGSLVPHLQVEYPEHHIPHIQWVFGKLLCTSHYFILGLLYAMYYNSYCIL